MGLVWVIATVNLPGLPIHTAARVDVDRLSIAGLISAGYLRVCELWEAGELDAEAGLTEGGAS